MRTPLAVALTTHVLSEAKPIALSVWRALRQPIAEDRDLDVAAWAQRNLRPADAEQIAACIAREEECAEAMQRLAELGIRAISEFDAEYPALFAERLGEKRPPVLFVAGDAALLSREAIGVVGSRDVDPAGSAFAVRVAELVAGRGLVLVSGGARGVDRTAMNAAFTSGGDALGVLADSLERVAMEAEMREALDSGRVCLATPFAPQAPFNVGNAMGRNKLIYALAGATVVVSAAEGSGGTWAGATEALKMRLGRVLVRADDAAPDGNAKLIRLGAVPLPSPDDLFDLLEAQTAEPGSLF